MSTRHARRVALALAAGRPDGRAATTPRGSAPVWTVRISRRGTARRGTLGECVPAGHPAEAAVQPGLEIASATAGAQSADDRMVLGGDHRLVSATTRQIVAASKGLRTGTFTTATDAMLAKRSGCGQRRGQHHAARHQRDIAAALNDVCAGQVEHVVVVEQDRDLAAPSRTYTGPGRSTIASTTCRTSTASATSITVMFGSARISATSSIAW